jgi:hypothetical protein
VVSCTIIKETDEIFMTPLAEIPAPTVAMLKSEFVGFEKAATGYEQPQRSALLRYLLYSMLLRSGRYEELFTDTAADLPEYVFYDSGRVISGRTSLIDFHRAQADAGCALTLPGQRVAAADWGFAAERVDQVYLTPAAALARGIKSEFGDTRPAERRKTAVVWRSDASGRMRSMHFYPAAGSETCHVPEDLVLQQRQIAEALESLIVAVRQRLQSSV